MLVILNWLPFSLSSFLGTLDLWPTGHTVSGGVGEQQTWTGGAEGTGGPHIDNKHSCKLCCVCMTILTSTLTNFRLINLVSCACLGQTFAHEWPETPFPCSFWFLVSLFLPELQDRANPLGQTVPFLLTHLDNRNTNGQRSAGRSGQAEMPICLGVSSPCQVVPGLQSRPYFYVATSIFVRTLNVPLHFSSFRGSHT